MKRLGLLADTIAAAFFAPLRGLDQLASVDPDGARKPRRGHGKRKGGRVQIGNAYSANGNRECARRRAQIAAGSLKRENGYAG